MTRVDPNKTYAGGNDEKVTKRFQAAYFLVSANYERYSGIWNDLKKSALLGTENYPKTPAATYDILFCYKIRFHIANHIHHPGKWRSSSEKIQVEARKY